MFREISRQLSYKYTQDMKYIEEEIRHSGPVTAVYEIVPEHITGKYVIEK